MFVAKSLTGDQLAEYQEQGYLYIGQTLTEQGLQQMRDQAMVVWAKEKGPFDPQKTWLQNALVPNIHHHAPLVRQYYFNGPLVGVAQQLIGPNIKAATSQLTFKMRGNIKPFAWHQDNAYGELDPYNAISCLTALDDANLENGCLWLVPGSHKEGQADYVHTIANKQSGLPVEMSVDERRGVPMPMRAGDCLLFHCHMLHKSEGNSSLDSDRRILFVRYADADAVEVYYDRRPRLGRLLRGATRFTEVEQFEADLPRD